MTRALDLQSMIFALQRFWADRGCLIWQPYHTEVGAGTMNPATFLRVLGPEPWNVAYVEPSIRPTDGRYGENPNRLQQHYQFQVILKPDPGNPQELYLESLEALGIELAKHDIRFVEDNWEQPAMGAWGLGWQVWMDGQEITQFTYFQQAGGVDLDPVSVELTYGLERIAIPLQGVHHFSEIRWGGGLTYGEVRMEAEREQSTFFFDVASVDRLRQLYDLYEAEAKAAIEAGLVLPAQDYILKCSHTFNVLDARGAVGVTERQAYFGRIRELARRVAMAYVQQRQGMEYPLLEPGSGRPQTSVIEPRRLGTSDSSGASGARPSGTSDSESFLLEVGVEELPPRDLRGAIRRLEERVPPLLAELRLDYGKFRVSGTPRRLVLLVEDLAPMQADVQELVKGPPAERAFDEYGDPTSAGLGFARSKGLRVDDLEITEIDGGRYAVARLQLKGEPAVEVLSAALPGLLASLQFDKSMRWNHTNVEFSRPVRWLLALFGGEVVPFSFAGVDTGRNTRGLRTEEPREFPVASPEDYFARLKSQGIILDPQSRSERILSAMTPLAKEVAGEISDDPALLAQVTDEVEAPAAVRGAFEEDFLRLPREVLVAVMKRHQNYFPVEREGRLLPYFLAVCNGTSQDRAAVAQGNEDVIRARFADAAFFIQNDRRHALGEYLADLDSLMFQKDLGSMGDKARRIRRLTETLAEAAGLSDSERSNALRAAELCKADLVTRMVVEMTSLQGVMGRYYALDAGEPEEVALAIEEHYMPRYSGDAGPKSRAGLIVGLADRLDSIAGLFAVDLAPTGAKDPFGLRRAALGLVSNLIAWDMDLDVGTAMQSAAGGLPDAAAEEEIQAAVSFVVERLRNLLLEEGHRYDVVEAAVGAQGSNPAGAARAARSLMGWVARGDWTTILPAYSRCVRITRELGERSELAPELFQEPAERDLYDALQKAEGEVAQEKGSVDGFLSAFLPMIPAVNRYFDDVLVMVEDPDIRKNRLGLLQRVAGLADGAADMSKLEGF
ncbi:MAG TPA: glycine--tRNA ligase subunit beta [Anaerolineales bacterium]|nr:glycine--tRNA ligase subunit beta [Anaerolineales bacterium]